MRNTFFGLFAAATLFTGTVRAAAPSFPSQERTTAYQSAVHTVLTERGWHITYDKAGKLTAERPSIKGEDGTREFIIGAGLDKRVQLRINFQPDGQGEVATSAFASVRYYNRLDPYIVGQSQYRSFAYRSPKLTQEYLDIMAQAKTNAAVRHVPRTDGSSQNSVALK